jgi:methanethiol S-methyltransferase
MILEEIMTISGPLAISAYFVLFALVHSLLADPAFKRWSRSVLGTSFDRWHKLAYNLLAMIMILPFLFILIFIPGRMLYQVSSPLSYLMIVCQLLSTAALLLALWQTGASSFLGLSQIREEDKGSGLVTQGFYARTRNPLFLFAGIFLWLSPLMTESLLSFNILATAYFYLGAIHEEKTLKEEFGEEYERYRKAVPMFLPKLLDQKANK